jgi:serine/threonine protein kinase
LITQNLPFAKADPANPNYSKIMDKNWKEFWKMHDYSGLSKNFIDFISKMFVYEPSERMSLQDIKDHPWYKGEVPSHRNIFKEFEKRQKILNNKKNNGVTTKSSESTESEKETINSNTDEIKLKKYSKFFDVKHGDELIDALIEFAKSKSYKFKKSNEFFRVNIYTEAPLEPLHIIVNVLKKRKEPLRRIEFIKESGSVDAYQKVFCDIKKFLNQRFTAIKMQL